MKIYIKKNYIYESELMLMSSNTRIFNISWSRGNVLISISWSLFLVLSTAILDLVTLLNLWEIILMISLNN